MNDEISETVKRYPEKFACFCYIPLQEITEEEQRAGRSYAGLPRLKFKKEDWPCEMDEGEV